MKAFQRKRLLKLADRLDTVPNRKFDLACWECSTAACAMGYACRMPAFNKAGLKFVNSVPTYKGRTGFDAAREFFGLSKGDSVFQDEALALFSPTYNPLGLKATPKKVAKQIRQLVVSKTKSTFSGRKANWSNL